MKGAAEPRANSPPAWIIPPKNTPHHTVKNNCNGNCIRNVIQPMKTGRTEIAGSPLASTVAPVAAE